MLWSHGCISSRWVGVALSPSLPTLPPRVGSKSDSGCWSYFCLLLFFSVKISWTEKNNPADFLLGPSLMKSLSSNWFVKRIGFIGLKASEGSFMVWMAALRRETENLSWNIVFILLQTSWTMMKHRKYDHIQMDMEDIQNISRCSFDCGISIQHSFDYGITIKHLIHPNINLWNIS